MVAFVGALLGVAFVLWPSLTPEGPPMIKSATLGKPTLSEVTFGQYLDRIEQSRTPYERNRLTRRGVLVEFDVTVTGYRGKRLPLRWQLIDVETGDQLDQARDMGIVPTATTDKGTLNFWVPNPKRRARRLFVQVQIYERAAGVPPLGRLRTPIFKSRYAAASAAVGAQPG